MTVLAATIGLLLIGSPLAAGTPSPMAGTTERVLQGLVEGTIFADGFESGDTTAWSLVVGEGLPEGSVCTLDEECASGLLCCYPCGVPGCDNQCIVPVMGGCPLLP